MLGTRLHVTDNANIQKVLRNLFILHSTTVDQAIWSSNDSQSKPIHNDILPMHPVHKDGLIIRHNLRLK